MNAFRNNPEEMAHQHKSGWLSTGDISEMDEDGFAILWTGKKTWSLPVMISDALRLWRIRVATMRKQKRYIAFYTKQAFVLDTQDIFPDTFHYFRKGRKGHYGRYGIV